MSADEEGQEPRAVGRHSEQIFARQGAAQQGGAHRVVASGGFPVPLVTTSAEELPLHQVAGESSLGIQDLGRADLPESRAPLRGSMAGAQAVWSTTNSRRTLSGLCGWSLRQHFAPCPVAEKAQCRRLGPKSCGSGRHLPFPRADGPGCGGGLAGEWLQSADSYVSELRLGHIEVRFEVPAWTARTRSQCKRALLRGRGPKFEAAEQRSQVLATVSESLRGGFPSAFHWPFRTYVVANCWLLHSSRRSPGRARSTVVGDSVVPALVGCQDDGQEELFILGDDGPREPQGAACEGFGSLDRAQPCVVDALWVVFLGARLSTAKALAGGRGPEGQPAALPEEDRWQAPEQSCLE